MARCRQAREPSRREAVAQRATPQSANARRRSRDRGYGSPSVHQGAQHVGAEENEHHADAQLEGMCHSVGHLITQQQDADAREQQGERVA